MEYSAGTEGDSGSEGNVHTDDVALGDREEHSLEDNAVQGKPTVKSPQSRKASVACDLNPLMDGLQVDMHTIEEMRRPGGLAADQWVVPLFFVPLRLMLASCFCGPCQLGRQRAVLESRPYNSEADLYPVCMLDFCCCAGNVVLGCDTRRRARDRYGIPGTPTDDFIASLFCNPCAIAQ
eukprot:Sspe_Gene.111025::Locus_92219_Transcript_1_1_Confidence_1.000_Length_584::g.111025::m.111025